MAADDNQRFELWQTLVLAVAAVLTAWAAFQSTKWSGVQANSYASASAARIQANRAENRVGQHTIIDTQMFVAWIDAVAAEERAGRPLDRSADGLYQPDPARESGFLFARFREEFVPVVQEWLATQPLVNRDAPTSPFDLPRYQQLDKDRVAELERTADDLAETAQEANQRGDNYVMTTILFALVLVVASFASKMTTSRARTILLGLAVTILTVTAVIVLSYPKEL